MRTVVKIRVKKKVENKGRTTTATSMFAKTNPNLRVVQSLTESLFRRACEVSNPGHGQHMSQILLSEYRLNS
jgi:hypothetical protein